MVYPFDFIASRLSKRLHVLRILKSLLSHNHFILVFTAIFRSSMDYASPVFLNAGSPFDSQLVTLCKSAFRIIHGFDITDCDKCCLTDVHERRKNLALRLFRQALHNTDHILHSLLPVKSQRSQTYSFVKMVSHFLSPRIATPPCNFHAALTVP